MKNNNGKEERTPNVRGNDSGQGSSSPSVSKTVKDLEHNRNKVSAGVRPLEPISLGLKPATSVDGKGGGQDGDDSVFTIDDAIEYFGIGKFQLLVSLFAGLSWTADAMEMMILSILSPELNCEFVIDEFQQASITICVFTGMMLSSTLWGKFCDCYGRKRGLFLISFSTFAMGVLSSMAPNFYVFLLLRGLTGVGIGGLPQSVTYYSEFLPMNHRAKCLVFMEVFWAVGAIAESGLAWAIMGRTNWRVLLAISSVPLLLSGLSTFLVPESIRYLVATHQEDNAYKVLETIARMNGKPMPHGRLVESVLTTERLQRRGHFTDLFCRGYRTLTALLMFIWFVSSFAYYGTVLFTTVLFQSGGNCVNQNMSLAVSKRPFNASAYEVDNTCRHLNGEDYEGLLITSVADLPALFVTAFLLEFIGRKKTLALNFAVFGVFILLLMFCLSRFWITAFLFVARGFAVGSFQSAFVYTPEVYPTTIRAVAMGTGSGFGRLGATLTPLIAQVIAKHMITLPMFVYAGVAATACLASLLLPIETRGRHMNI